MKVLGNLSSSVKTSNRKVSVVRNSTTFYDWFAPSERHCPWLCPWASTLLLNDVKAPRKVGRDGMLIISTVMFICFISSSIEDYNKHNHVITVRWYDKAVLKFELIIFTLQKKYSTNGGRKFRRMAAESSNERRPKVPTIGGRNFRPMAAISSDEWRPKVPMKASESSDKWRPKYSMNGGQKFRRMAAESSDEWRPKVPTNGSDNKRSNYDSKFVWIKCLN